MDEISTWYFRENIAKVLREVQDGKSKIITKHGKPVARVIPMDEEQTELPDLTEFRSAIKLKSGTINSEKLIRKLRDEERH